MPHRTAGGRRGRLSLPREVPALVLAIAGTLVLARPAMAALPDDPDDDVWGTNGTVYAIARTGSVVYLGGDFTALVSPGGITVARSNLAAIDTTTGKPSSWAPRTNGTVRALARYRRTIYIGGSFTTVNGRTRSRLAGVGLRGKLREWTVDISSTVRALARIERTIYMGGDFQHVNGQFRGHLAAVSTSGELLDWNPSANDRVRAIATWQRSVLVGGEFTSVNGDGSGRRLARLNPDTAELRPFTQPPSYPVFDIVAADGYAYAAIGGPGGRVVGWTIRGEQLWTTYADGDAQAVGLAEGRVVAGGHWIYISGSRIPRLAALDPSSGALDEAWVPRPDRGGVWVIKGSADLLLVGGNNFEYVNGVRARRYAQFSL